MLVCAPNGPADVQTRSVVAAEVSSRDAHSAPCAAPLAAVRAPPEPMLTASKAVPDAPPELAALIVAPSVRPSKLLVTTDTLAPGHGTRDSPDLSRCLSTLRRQGSVEDRVDGTVRDDRCRPEVEAELVPGVVRLRRTERRGQRQCSRARRHRAGQDVPELVR